MGEVTKGLLMSAAIVIALQVMQWTLGGGITLTVAVAAMSFCIGALWGGGKAALKYKDQAQ